MIKPGKSRLSSTQKVLLAILGFGIASVCLAIDCVAIVWTAIVIAFIYTITIVWRYGIRWWKYRHGKVAGHERFLLFIVSLAVLFMTTGTALYLWAFTCEATSNIANNSCNDEPYLFINAEYLLRSLACSFMLFTGNIESNVLDGIHEHQYIKGLISLQAFLSFTCTVAVLVSLVYARMCAYYKFHRATMISQQHNHLYVFFGMDEPSRLLAKSIKEKEGNQSILIFVENNRIDDSDKNGWNSIVEMLTHRRQTFTEVEDLDARVTFTETRLCDINNDILNGKAEADILGELNLLKLRELILQLGSICNDAQLHIFFLSENEDENVRALSTLTLDKTIHQFVGKSYFYCHARKNSISNVSEDIAFKQGLEVRIIDSSYLSVELLKADENNHPVKLVEIDKQNPTTVSSPFNSLIVGFDEVGRDALKFLYEFGAFVDTNATPENERRSPFHCIVVDSRMNELEGVFSTFAPTVMEQTNKDRSKLVTLKQGDCRSSEFFRDIVNDDFCKELNYIVIAVGDDEMGMMLAIRLLNHIRRVKEDLTRLRIYVRCYRTDKESYMQQIATYYNDGCKDGCTETNPIIIPFGQKQQIYSYDMIINDELIQNGKIFQAEYARLKGETERWDTRRTKLRNAGTIDKMRELRRKESQDLANALHMSTKLYLLKQCMPNDTNWSDFFNRLFDENGLARREGAFSYISYPMLDYFENKTMLNLARLEHLRWVASHEMLGYTKANENLHESKERTREHNCLRPWQELDKESEATTKEKGWDCDYKSYDFCVVDNSILLNKDKLLEL